MAFRSTVNRSHFGIIRKVEAIAAVFREHVAYTGDGIKTHLPEIVESLHDTVRNPVIYEWEVQEQVSNIKAEFPEILNNAQGVVLEALQTAGFSRGSGYVYRGYGVSFSSITVTELLGAKNSTMSSVLMNLESPVVVTEDIGRQILAYGHRKPVQTFVDQVIDLKLEDIQKTAAKILETPRTMASYGDGGGGAPPVDGQVLRTEHIFHEDDVAAYATLSGDSNPIHTNLATAVSAGFKACVVHGMLCASLFPPLIRSHFPGAHFQSKSLRFKEPALVGDCLEVEVKVLSRSQVANSLSVEFDMRCYKKQDRVLVLEGKSSVIVSDGVESV